MTYDQRSENTPKTWRSTLTLGWLPNTSEYYYSQTGYSKAGTVWSWRGKRRERDEFGFLAPNEFSLLKATFAASGGSLTQVYTHPTSGQYVANYNELLFTAAIRPPEFNHNVTVPTVESFGSEAHHALIQAQAEAWSRANGPDIPGATWIVEAKETAVWLKSLATSMHKVTTRYEQVVQELRQRLKNEKSLLKRELSSAWMQYRYAVTPLVLQTEEALDLLKGQKKELKAITGFVKAKRRTDDNSYPLDWGSIHFNISTEDTLSFRGACKLYPAAQREAMDYGLQPYDLLSAAWELVRLSFVLDWFIDIGGFISMHRPGTCQVKYQSNTIVTEEKTVSKATSLGPYSQKDVPEWDISFTDEKAVRKRVYVNRDTSVFKPTLPYWNMETLSLMRQIDAAALLFQFFGSRKK